MTVEPTHLDWPVLIRPLLAGFEPTRDTRKAAWIRRFPGRGGAGLLADYQERTAFGGLSAALGADGDQASGQRQRPEAWRDPKRGLLRRRAN